GGAGAGVVGGTATAAPVVRDEILGGLGLPADTRQMVRGFARPNLGLRAVTIGGARERSAQVDGVLGEMLGRPRAGRGTGIVYAPTRKSAEEEAERLAALGWRAEVYPAGRARAAPARAQRAVPGRARRAG